MFVFKVYAYFDDITCNVDDPKIIEELKCWLQLDSRGFLTMSASLTSKVDLWHIVNRFRFLIDMYKTNQSYLSVDVDICSAFSDWNTNFVMRLIAEEIYRVSNLPMSCPLKKGIRYEIRNFTIISKYIPAFTPRLKWVSSSNFYLNKAKKRSFLFENSGKVDSDFKKLAKPIK